MNIPRIMIAAAGSGSGKTLLSCALMMLFSQEGKSVSAIKCGPDYIDPMFHRTVLGLSLIHICSMPCRECGSAISSAAMLLLRKR